MKIWARLRGRRVKIGGRNIINIRYADDTILLVKSSSDLKQFVMKVKKESSKARKTVSEHREDKNHD